MKKLLAITLFCFLPAISFAQSQEYTEKQCEMLIVNYLFALNSMHKATAEEKALRAIELLKKTNNSFCATAQILMPNVAIAPK